MSDGGRDRALLALEVWKSSQKWSEWRSAVRSIAWLGLLHTTDVDSLADTTEKIPLQTTDQQAGKAWNEDDEGDGCSVR